MNATLIIKDLSVSNELDHKAMSTVRGGFEAFPVEPNGGNGGAPIPGGSVSIGKPVAAPAPISLNQPPSLLDQLKAGHIPGLWFAV